MMKKKNLLFLWCCSAALLTGCQSVPENIAIETIPVQTLAPETEISVTETALPETIPEDDEKFRERKLLKLICEKEFSYDAEVSGDFAEFMQNDAERLSERVFGEIESEEDAETKGKIALAELVGESYVNSQKTEFTVQFQEEYAVWIVTMQVSSGKMAFTVIRQDDGKILGVYC